MRSAPAQFAVLETVQQALLHQTPDLRKQARRLSSGFVAGAARLRSASASPAPPSPSDATEAANWDSDADDDDVWPALAEVGIDQSGVAATPTVSPWTEAGGRRLLVLGYGADVQIWEASGDPDAMTEITFVKAPCGAGAAIVDAALAADGADFVLLCVRAVRPR